MKYRLVITRDPYTIWVFNSKLGPIEGRWHNTKPLAKRIIEPDEKTEMTQYELDEVLAHYGWPVPETVDIENIPEDVIEVFKPEPRKICITK